MKGELAFKYTLIASISNDNDITYAVVELRLKNSCNLYILGLYHISILWYVET